MTSANDRHVIEALLLRWGDNNSSGRTVTFQLPADGDHPFKGYPCGTANGQRLALSFALIDDDETVREPQDKKSSLTQQAGILCNDKLFWKFLEMEKKCFHDTNKTPDDAAAAVRRLCEVQSRREFDTDPEAAKRWRALRADYDNWRHGRV